MFRFNTFDALFSLTLCAVALVLLTSCHNRGSARFTNVNDPGTDDDSPFDPADPQEEDNYPEPEPSPIPNKTGYLAVTAAEKAALNNLFSDFQKGDLRPKISAGVPSALKTEIQGVLQEQANGANVSVKLMGLAGKVLEECTKKVTALGPVAGQNLIGAWATSKNDSDCKVSFNIEGAGTYKAQSLSNYRLTGGLSGTVTASTNGSVTVQANPWTGTLNESSQAANGTLRHPEFYPATGGKNPEPASACSSPVVLKTNANPIPAHYVEAVAELGCCFRESVMLISPTMVQLMAELDPTLKALLNQSAACTAQ